jgi:hypothetical protein
MILRRTVVASVVSVVFVSAALALTVARPEDKGTLSAEAGDLSGAAAIEIRDPGGQVVLSGTFGAGDTDDDGGDVERVAELKAPSGAARGEAEIEISGGAAGGTKQELEVDVEGLPAAATFTVVVDGQSVATITTDARGKADADLSGPVRK